MTTIKTDVLGEVTRDGEAWSVRYVRSLDTPRPRVWDAITNHEQVATWMMTDEMTLEPRLGGAVHYRWGPSDRSDGDISTFDPPRTIEYSWREGSHTSMVRFELEETTTGTDLTLHHWNLSRDEVNGVGPGWHTHLELLAATLASEPFDFDARFDELKPRYAAVIEDL
jgi:uncharacterized protein YndB with AHSA1/START domain